MSAKDRIAGTPSYGQSWYSVHKYAGKTFNWCPSDEEWRFDQNMADPENRAILETFGWTKENITYTFNKNGFRSEEFITGNPDSVLFLGCSLTVGVGVDLESSFAYKIASRLGLRRYNLGVGGGSPDMCFRLAHHWIPRLRPRYVFMLTPYAARKEIVMDDKILQFLPNNRAAARQNTFMEPLEPFYDAWLSHPANTDTNLLKCSLGVQSICDSIGTRLIEIPLQNLELQTLMTAEGWSKTVARDILHPGTEWHEAVADKFLDALNLGA